MAAFKLEDFQNIDPNNVGNWPIPVKIVVILLVCILAAGAGFYFITQEQLADLDKKEQEEAKLKEEFRTKQGEANSLEKLREQLKQIEDSFKELLKKLPTETEVPGLLVDISQTGLANGLNFELFQPMGERDGQGGFYKELPIKLRVRGTYHALGKFVSDIALLQRIVTQHNITIAPVPNNKSGDLTLDTTAKTYRYKDAEEEKASAPKPAAPPPAAAAAPASKK
jgi:type IV pilus assembly protein PilO